MSKNRKTPQNTFFIHFLDNPISLRRILPHKSLGTEDHKDDQDGYPAGGGVFGVGLFGSVYKDQKGVSVAHQVQ